MEKVLALVLGGGRGERLYPLTRERAKPAVPFGGKYRLVDIPISNCIHADFRKIYILTQFNSSSLHNHISNTYIFDSFNGGFVEIMAAELTYRHSSWYRGTADAVRQNFLHFHTQQPTHYLILSGDQLYRMDLRDFYNRHVQSGADMSVAATPIGRSRAPAFGIMRVDSRGRIVEFVEKPGPDRDISALRMPEPLPPERWDQGEPREYLASMGIYIFNAGTLEKALDNDLTDFGKEVFPACIDRYQINCYLFSGFWEDIGTIKSFYEANVDLTSISPNFNFYDETRPIFTHRRDLPASKINYSTIIQTLTAEGSIITNSNIMHSIVGIRTIIETGASLDGVVCMGADFYETPEQKQANQEQKTPNVGIGRGSIIRRAIIDKNARIGEECRIGVDDRYREDGDFGSYYIRDGIIVIPKNTILPPGTVI